MQKRLSEFSTSDQNSGVLPTFSWNGRTYVFLDAANSSLVHVKRRNRTSQTFATMDFAGGSSSIYPVDYQNADHSGSGGISHKAGRSTPHTWANRGGTKVVTADAHRYPVVLSMVSDEPSDVATSFEVDYAGGEPSFIAGLKAEFPGTHWRPFGAFDDKFQSPMHLRTHFSTATPYYALLGPDGPPKLEWIALYDHFADKYLVLLRAVTVNRVETAPSGSDLDIRAWLDSTVALFEYDFGSGAWSEADRRTELETHFQSWQETGAGDFVDMTSTVGNIDGVLIKARATAGQPYKLFQNELSPAESTVAISEKRRRTRLAWLVPNIARTGMGSPPTSSGSLSVTDAPVRVLASGAEVAQLPALASAAASSLRSWARDGLGTLVDAATAQWHNRQSGVTTSIATDQPFGPKLSGLGRQMLLFPVASASDIKLYAGDALVRSWAQPVPAADAAAYALYPAAPGDGFWFLSDFVGWSHEREAFKATRYKRVAFTPSGPVGLTVHGGVVHTSNFGDIVLPTAPALDGFTIDLPVRYVSWNGSGFDYQTAAEMEAGPLNDVVFEPNASTYVIGGTAPDSYAWETDVALVKYDPEKDTFSFPVVYDGSVETTQDPANAGSPPLTLTDALLVQDELLPNK